MLLLLIAVLLRRADRYTPEKFILLVVPLIEAIYAAKERCVVRSAVVAWSIAVAFALFLARHVCFARNAGVAKMELLALAKVLLVTRA